MSGEKADVIAAKYPHRVRLLREGLQVKVRRASAGQDGLRGSRGLDLISRVSSDYGLMTFHRVCWTALTAFLHATVVTLLWRRCKTVGKPGKNFFRRSAAPDSLPSSPGCNTPSPSSPAESLETSCSFLFHTLAASFAVPWKASHGAPHFIFLTARQRIQASSRASGYPFPFSSQTAKWQQFPALLTTTLGSSTATS